jgi:Arc/MetJ family transcription regulator
MRTNIELDDVLVQQGLKLSKLKTKKDLIHQALENYVLALKRKQILNLRGKVEWEGDLKKMRQA